MFKLRPVLDQMLEFYERPRNQERFATYLRMLQGNSKSDMELPIGGYNPMAKEHLSDKLNELKQLNAEIIASECLKNISSARDYQVVINIADDLLGGWTNRFTTDYQSKFELNALVERGFCTPYFWSSEEYSVELIKERVASAAFRTRYFEQHGKPITLEDHVKQEDWVQQQVDIKKSAVSGTNDSSKLYDKLKRAEDYPTIIAFLYGDEAAESLGIKAL